jgi:Reverse transcriptase (RNA-dependent DNA polymerase)
MEGYNQHKGFADVLRAMGFIPSQAKADIWMRENNNLYEYIAVYVDDLLIAAQNPKEIVQTLKEQHKFKLKGVALLTYLLGCDYFHDRDHDGTLCFGPRKYITKMMDQFKNRYDCKPKEYTSPLEKGDNPEVDISESLDEEGIKQYQTMRGCLQWSVSLIIKSMHRHKKRHMICFRRIMITNDITLESLKSVLYFTIFNYCFGSNIHGDMIF